jgi:hypothetical protein
VSREGAREKTTRTPPAAGTPIWVWVIYALGLLAVAIFAFSILFTLGAAFLSDDVPVGYDVSIVALVIWGGLVVAAIVTWLYRRRQRR